MKTRENAAFTLVELLTVIAIIGILATLVLVSIGRVRSAAHQTRCASNLRQIGVAAALFAQDNKNRTLPIYYYDKLENHYMPAITQGDFENKTGVWMCPVAERRRTAYTSTGRIENLTYAINGTRVGMKEQSGTENGQRSLVTHDQIANPSRMLYFTDGNKKYWTRKPNQEPAASANFCHTDKANVLFFDFHVQAVKNPANPVADFYDKYY
ncbi:type II secretion system protein [Opitutaceae bacterium TAV4]|nr:type II secretion system protein [Opitutaceae bacterium TAV4]RRK01127.1 type II secretion system protein [Opitutaceae bacterium TAV3]